MLILDGKGVAQAREQAIQERVQKFQKKYKKTPVLAVIQVGFHTASEIYLKAKEKACQRVGIEFQRYDLEPKTSNEELDSLMLRLNVDPDVHGVFVQMPVPANYSTQAIFSQLSPFKDVDGLSYENMGLLLAGQPRVEPCTPKGIMVLLKHYKIDIQGKHAVMVGRSQIVGRPMAQMLVNANATVTICHSQTKNLTEITKQADILVVAAGKHALIGREHVKKDAVVIDVGIHRVADKKLAGDVRFEELKDWAKAATPVPFGVGPMTIAMLLENTMNLAESWESFGRNE